jgi:hypothetical protein
VSDEKFLRNNVSFSIYIKKIGGVVYESDQSNGARVSFEYDRLAQSLTSKGVDMGLVCVCDDDDKMPARM